MSKVSVIVPVYNVKDYVDECINSIVSQSYKDIEIIIVDDGSKDGSGERCDEWATKDSRIVVLHQKNMGLSEARNTGLDVASGEYITFIDSDDYYEVDALQTLVYNAEKNNADMVVCKGKRVSENGKQSISEEVIDYSDSFIDEETFWRRYINDMYYIVVWSKLYRRDVFSDIRFPVGEINEDEAILWMVLSKCKKIYATNDIVYNYRIRNSSIMRSNFSEKNLSQPKRLLDEINYIEAKHFTEDTKFAVIRYAFVKGTGVLATGYESLTDNPEIKEKIDSLYKRYIPVAKYISRASKASFGVKAQMMLYCYCKKIYFIVRKYRKTIKGI